MAVQAPSAQRSTLAPSWQHPLRALHQHATRFPTLAPPGSPWAHPPPLAPPWLASAGGAGVPSTRPRHTRRPAEQGRDTHRMEAQSKRGTPLTACQQSLQVVCASGAHLSRKSSMQSCMPQCNIKCRQADSSLRHACAGRQVKQVHGSRRLLHSSSPPPALSQGSPACSSRPSPAPCPTQRWTCASPGS